MASVKVDRFGWGRMSDALRIRLRRDWMDALQDFTLAEVKAACDLALAENPRDAVNEQRVKAMVIEDRVRRLSAIPRPAAPDLVDRRPDAQTRARQAAELLGNIKRMEKPE